jgi:uncharacterized protein (DUF58 family)
MLYELTPLTRGQYEFGNLHLFMRNPIGLAIRKISFALAQQVAVYPSVIQMKQFELKAFTRISNLEGVRKIRRIGHSYEFEQIKKYVQGDDYRSLNWKATGRKAELMVNQYEDEKSQQVYLVIDKSRSMLMPFHGLTLMDYAINTSLVISNIALRKHDKAGIITFSNKLGSVIKAENKPGQLHLILETLYNQRERPYESNFELLYQVVRNRIRQRSLVFLFTNFQSQYALQRVLPLLRKLNRLHLLCVIFFENTELTALRGKPAATADDIYLQAVAFKMADDQLSIVQQLQQFGIQSLLTRPEDLSLNSVNKYLELKSRGLI